MSMKVVSVNIERHKHFDLVKAFLAKENPEIICLMEVCERDVEVLAGTSYPNTVFAPNDVLPRFEEGEGMTGVAILSKNPITESDKFYCGEDPTSLLAPLVAGDTHLPILILAKIDGFQIGAVHFSWTADGSIDERQRRHVDILLDYLRTKGELVMCGDFNIPRGNEMYKKLVTNYRDNIPVEIQTTIDPKLHRANFEIPGKLKFVVDYVWTCLPAGRVPPKYRVSDVRVVEGVSDHCGVVFKVSVI